MVCVLMEAIKVHCPCKKVETALTLTLVLLGNMTIERAIFGVGIIK